VLSFFRSRWSAGTFRFLRLYSQALVFGTRAPSVRGRRNPRFGPDARLLLWWLVGQRSFFQLELFSYLYPETRPHSADWRLQIMAGYASESASQFRSVSEEARAPRNSTPSHRRSRRRASDAPRSATPRRDHRRGHGNPALQTRADCAYVTSSVGDSDAARVFYGDVLKLSWSRWTAFTRRPLKRLGIAGARARWVFLSAWRRVLEVVSYRNPKGRAKPRDWRLSDQCAIQNDRARQPQGGCRRTRAQGSQERPGHDPLRSALSENG
jgi:hypothetical protein